MERIRLSFESTPTFLLHRAHSLATRLAVAVWERLINDQFSTFARPTTRNSKFFTIPDLSKCKCEHGSSVFCSSNDYVRHTREIVTDPPNDLIVDDLTVWDILDRKNTSALDVALCDLDLVTRL